MNIDHAYDSWASQYDSNVNGTRDAEGKMLRSMLADFRGAHILEMGCGTGKNTDWLQHRATALTCVDFSPGMLEQARKKLQAPHIQFVRADMQAEWTFASGFYDLVVFSLVLEHIENLEPVLQKATEVLQPGGWLYVGELHPYRQYAGSKARFETEAGTQVLTCYNHHISHFTAPLFARGLQLISLQESFDDALPDALPRVLGLLFQKS